MVNHRQDSDSSVRLELLRALERQAGFVSGGRLGQLLRISRTAVWKHVNALRALGYRVESAPRRGYRLISCPASLNELEIRKRLHTRFLGREIHCLGSVPSTQDVAFKLAQAGAPEGTVVLAGEQSGGRGRLGRAFFSPAGGLWFSFILRPPLQPQLCLPISLLIGTAVSQAIRDTAGLPAMLKWPNDVLIGGRKVAGILAEIVAETDAVRFLVCGAGLNANIEARAFPPGLKNIATSIRAELGREVSAADLLCAVLESLERHYADFLKLGPRSVTEAWRRSPNMLGRQVKVAAADGPVEGTALDLDDSGALLVRGRDGQTARVVVGDVHLAAA